MNNPDSGFDWSVGIIIAIGIGIYRILKGPRAAPKRAVDTGGMWSQCSYINPRHDPRSCGLPGVHKRAAAIGVTWDHGPCEYCVKGKPRWLTGAEVREHQQKIADGWLKADGRSLPDLDVYKEAFVRGITPREVLAERASHRQ